MTYCKSQWLSNFSFLHKYHVNSLWPSDIIWRHKSGPTVAPASACFLTAPNHCLGQCWPIISKVQWHSSEGYVTRDTSAIYHWNKLEITNLQFDSNPQVDNGLLTRRVLMAHTCAGELAYLRFRQRLITPDRRQAIYRTDADCMYVNVTFTCKLQWNLNQATNNSSLTQSILFRPHCYKFIIR